jgi:hypothetical protein
MFQFKKWTKEEEENLLSEFKQKSKEDIAKMHGRTVQAITFRLKELAFRMKNDNITEDIIFDKTGVNMDDIIEYQKEIDRKSSSKIDDNSLDTKLANSRIIKELQLEIRELKVELKELKLKLKELE